MKAAVYYETGGPEVFRYEEIAEPEVRPGGVLVDVKAVGIQGGDLLHRQGGVMASTPHVVGYQAAGVVREVGSGVEGIAAGQHVVVMVGFGSHAEVVSAPARSAYVVPDAMPFEVAASIPIEFGTAHDCLFEFGHLAAGETVLVHAGAGGVGLAAIQLAKAAGATVIATASTDERLARLHEFGMDHGVNYVRDDPGSAVLALTDRRGVDLVVDPVGGRTLEASITALAYRGRISWVGRAGREERPPEVWPIMQKNASITGVFLGAEAAMRPERVRAMIGSCIDRVASGELRVVVEKSFPLADAAEAHRFIESRQAFGRVVLVPDDDAGGGAAEGGEPRGEAQGADGRPEGRGHLAGVDRPHHVPAERQPRLHRLRAFGAEARFGAGGGAAGPVRFRRAGGPAHQAELQSLVDRNPYAHVTEHTKVHVAFYAAPPDPSALAAVDVARFAPEECTVLGRDVVFHLPGGLGESRLAQTFFRRAKDGTARNWRTVNELLALL